MPPPHRCHSRSSVVPMASLQLLLSGRSWPRARPPFVTRHVPEHPGPQFTGPGSASASGFFVAVFTVGRRGYALSRQGRRLSQMSCRCERRRTTRARTRVMVTVHAAAPRSAYHHLRHSVAWSSRPPASRAAPGGTGGTAELRGRLMPYLRTLTTISALASLPRSHRTHAVESRRKMDIEGAPTPPRLD